jgi:hypothetical protein
MDTYNRFVAGLFGDTPAEYQHKCFVIACPQYVTCNEDVYCRDHNALYEDSYMYFDGINYRRGTPDPILCLAQSPSMEEKQRNIEILYEMCARTGCPMICPLDYGTACANCLSEVDIKESPKCLQERCHRAQSGTGGFCTWHQYTRALGVQHCICIRCQMSTSGSILCYQCSGLCIVRQPFSTPVYCRNRKHGHSLLCEFHGKICTYINKKTATTFWL